MTSKKNGEWAVGCERKIIGETWITESNVQATTYRQVLSATGHVCLDMFSVSFFFLVLVEA